MELILLRQALVLIASAVGSYTDFKTGLINDWITLPLIGIGILLNLIFFDLNSLLLGLIVFVLGYGSYYLGKLGGGDVKLFTGMAFVLPFFEGKIFVLSALFFAAISSVIFYSVFYSIKYLRKGIEFELIKKKIPLVLITVLLFVFYFWFVIESSFVSIELTALIFCTVLFGLIFFIFEEGIRKEFFLKKIKTNELEEDEVPAPQTIEEIKKIFPLGFKGVIGKKEKQELIKAGITKVFVYRDLPKFGPFIFIGSVLAMILPPITLLGVI
ncbi:MAG: prepilin peptidase [Candidatus Diapherotrites archaeon]|nr:prepilin peptidase [Candidatus Diapherotrites archaeon]